jgi:ABC-type branched-subunit amino acid transport system substrate-binding protein
MRSRRRAFPLLASVAVVAALAGAVGVRSRSGPGSPPGELMPAAGCSLVVKSSTSQCETTADCLALGPAFAPSFCLANTCQVACTSNKDCSANSGTGPRICRPDRSCAFLLSEDCQSVIAGPGDLDDDSVLWFGLLAPFDPATKVLSQAKIDAANLARADFINAAGGLPPIANGGTHRHFAFVACDESANADRAARHLTDDVRVPAIIGPIYSGDLIDVATNVTIGDGVLLISASATSTLITALADNGLVWRTAPSDTEQGQAIAELVSEAVEPALQGEIDGGALRLGVAYKGDGYGLGMEGALENDLVFNGRAATQNGANYGTYNYGLDSDPDAGAVYAETVNELLALAPHVVIIVGTREAIVDILSPLEQKWAEPAFRPRYILTDGTYPLPELIAAVSGNEDLRSRIIGTTPGTNSPEFQGFVQYYNGTFHDGTVPIESTAGTYDAAYMLAYAAAAVGANVTGATLTGAFPRLVSPEVDSGAARVDVGFGAINSTLDTLADGGSVVLNGVSGPLDFDLATGDTRTDIQLWCLRRSDGGATFETTSVYYGAVSNTLENLPDGGSICP